MIFTIAKYIHLISISLSITGFIIRSILLIKNHSKQGSNFKKKTKSRFLEKKLPQYIDITLLTSALVMLWQWQWLINPFYTPWLAEKLFMLCCYVLLGMVALHWGKTLSTQLIASALAIFSFIYIVTVALTKTTLIF